MVRTEQRQAINKRRHRQTEEPHRKGLHDPDDHEGMATHPEPDILECESRGP